jgi:uroporphyrinogen decarboxylase
VNNRQNVQAAIECRQGDYVPLWELSFEIWDAFGYGRLVLGREFEALSADQREVAMHRNAEIFVSVSRELGFSMIRTPSGFWEVGPGQLAYLVMPRDAIVRQMEIVRKLAGDDLVLMAPTGGVMAIPGPGEYEDFCLRLFDDPDSIEQEAKSLLALGLEWAKKFRDVGADAALTSSDLGDNHGPFFSPPQMDRFVLPYLRQWAAEVRKLGMYSIIHTDGMLMPILDAIADSGVDAMQAVDPVAGMDMKKTKDAVAGRMCLCGNVDCGLLLNGPPQRVYDTTREVLTTCKAGGGLILGASNAVFTETPKENYLAMIHAWRDFGKF